MKTTILNILAAIFLAGCTTSNTNSIAASSAEAPIRQFCPAFKTGEFSTDSARSYGDEQITTFQNGSKFNCRCIVRSASAAPTCTQVRRFVLGNIE